MLTREGWATWNLEYRCVHQEGGGWPGTFLDAAHGVEALREAAKLHPLDLSRVVAIGHSAGGQLALRAAVCGKLPLCGVVSIGGIPDMAAFAADPAGPCEGRHIQVMGGTPAEHPDRYAEVSPAERLPLGVPQVLIWGENDTVTPRSLFVAYEERAKAAGDEVTSVTVAGAGHHDLMSPGLATYPILVEQIRRLLSITMSVK